MEVNWSQHMVLTTYSKTRVCVCVCVCLCVCVCVCCVCGTAYVNFHHIFLLCRSTSSKFRIQLSCKLLLTHPEIEWKCKSVNKSLRETEAKINHFNERQGITGSSLFVCLLQTACKLFVHSTN
ncbi:hypothetical protein XENOCAPTIV_028514 [Xenoophorus captivus]|uniref:Secreted protein n=1 Tax=Xenoophorus captivus TaxID=1517983 RepID=A0ABV0RVL7_9TELE